MSTIVVEGGVQRILRPLPLVQDDGGRAEAGFKGLTGDCVVRAIAIASRRPYKAVYDDLNEACRSAPCTVWGKREMSRGASRTGIGRSVYEPYLLGRGWTWHPKMRIGSGCTVHLVVGEVPTTGAFVVSLSRHLAAVVDGVVRDAGDPRRGGTRCVYGWYVAPAKGDP